MLYFYTRNHCEFANIRRTQINTPERELFIRSLSQFRRATLQEFVSDILRRFSDFEFSMPLMATLLLLEEKSELSIKQIAELLGRSVSTTSRLIDQLVERNLVNRREDEQDRRMKRVAITEEGRTFISTIERRRAEAQ